MSEFGLAIDRFGCKMSYNHEHKRKYSRHRTIFPVEERTPSIQDQVKIANLASVIGSVELDDRVYVGPGSILHGDVNPIRVGEQTVIGDYAIFVTTPLTLQLPGSINIGRNVFIGDKVVLKSCLIDDDAYIGDASFVQEGALVERGAIVLPHSVVPTGAVLKANSVWAGNSVVKVRDATPEDVQFVQNERTRKRNYYDSLNQEIVFADTSALV